jgi:hypothetical protein
MQTIGIVATVAGPLCVVSLRFAATLDRIAASADRARRQQESWQAAEKYFKF